MSEGAGSLSTLVWCVGVVCLMECSVKWDTTQRVNRRILNIVSELFCVVRNYTVLYICAYKKRLVHIGQKVTYDRRKY